MIIAFRLAVFALISPSDYSRRFALFMKAHLGLSTHECGTSSIRLLGEAHEYSRNLSCDIRPIGVLFQECRRLNRSSQHCRGCASGDCIPDCSVEPVQDARISKALHRSENVRAFHYTYPRGSGAAAITCIGLLMNAVSHSYAQHDAL